MEKKKVNMILVWWAFDIIIAFIQFFIVYPLYITFKFTSLFIIVISIYLFVSVIIKVLLEIRSYRKRIAELDSIEN